MPNSLQNQGQRLTAKALPGSAWERLKPARETKQVSFVGFSGLRQKNPVSTKNIGFKADPLTHHLCFWPHVRKSCFFLLAAVYLFVDQAGVQAQRSQNNQRSQNIQNITVSPGFSPQPMIVQGVGGGSVPISQIAGRQETANGPCVGFSDSKPDHNLVLTSSFNYLSIQVESREDTTLLVRGPGGIWCNDEYRGKNPGLAGQWLPGTYEIWVGSYGKDKQAPYTLRIGEQR